MKINCFFSSATGACYLLFCFTAAAQNTFPSSGNVGIGTSSPQFTLQLSEAAPVISLVSTSTTQPYAAIRGNNSTWIFGYNGPDGQEDISIGAQDGTGTRTMTFAAGGSAKMKVLANGNVGIGTTIPDQRLTVKGKIHAEEIKVDLSVPGPDYVFKKDYNLPTLKEVETYISQNQHLPEIASAAEMKEKGIELGDMNMKLLKKIEELTLYMIDFKKQMDMLKEENQKLKEEVREVKKK